MAVTKLTRVQQIARALGMKITPLSGKFYGVAGSKFGCDFQTPHTGVVIDALVDEIEMHEAAQAVGLRRYDVN